MIRLAKRIRILEWGEGTNTLNQVWTPVGEGRITAHTMKNGLTTLEISMDQALTRKSDAANPHVKLAQPGEGMTGGADGRWGEVAMGTLRRVENGGRSVVVEIMVATKIDKRKVLPRGENALPPPK